MYPNLFAAMAMRRMSQHQLAGLIGIHEKTMGEKLRGVTDFKLSEMRGIQRILGGSLDFLFSSEPCLNMKGVET